MSMPLYYNNHDGFIPKAKNFGHVSTDLKYESYKTRKEKTYYSYYFVENQTEN